jgi:hypothetical protein
MDVSQAIQSVELHDLIVKVKKHNFQGKLLWFDPGETTGWALFRRNPEHTFLEAQGQLETWPIEACVRNFTDLIQSSQPTRVGYESYHIYQWRLKEHTFAEVPTLQIIGCLRTLCIQKMMPYDSQTAQTGKGFSTDDKLKKWGIFHPNMKHARDAVRHATHYLIFGKGQP